MLNITNLYPHTIWVSVMFYHPKCEDGGNWEKAGWWKINPGQTKTVLAIDLDKLNRYYCYYAHAANGVHWAGPYVRSVPHSAYDLCEWTADTDSHNVGFRLLDIDGNNDFTLILVP